MIHKISGGLQIEVIRLEDEIRRICVLDDKGKTIECNEFAYGNLTPDNIRDRLKSIQRIGNRELAPALKDARKGK